MAVGVAACGRAALLAVGRHGIPASGPALLLIAAGLGLSALAEEAVLRGVIQRALPVPGMAAAAIALIVGLVSARLGGISFSTMTPVIVALIVIGHVCGALVYAFTGRVTAAWVSRVVLVGVAAFV
jgi:hypothetical protein